MKRIWLILFLLIVILASSCSKIHIPSQKKLISTMEDAGYTVDKFTAINDVKDISRIVATKGDSTLDVCYQVAGIDDVDKILDFYGDTYEKSYITGNNGGFVYFASDKTAWAISKIDNDLEN